MVSTLTARLDVRSRLSRVSRSSGFSLIEVMLVVALIAVVAGVSIPISTRMISRAKATSIGLEVVTWLEGARNRAQSERRNFEVTFDAAAHRLRVERVEPDFSRTLIFDRELPDEMRFMLFGSAPDSPDLFGNASPVDFDGPSPHMFTSDGSFVDANGDPSNGTLFMGKDRQIETARSITVFGATGLIRSYKYSGNGWFQ
jgi:prepilin-type N-terminal cleavage/methylation domain-containing protein